jgi:lysophospholipase L1-like esterase
VWTNDIRHQSARRVAQEIANLGTQIVQDSPATSLVISSILPRTDKPELSKKVVEANELIKAFCNGHNWEFMNHAAIDSSCLNMRGLHLNRKGTTTMARNISSYISTT